MAFPNQIHLSFALPAAVPKSNSSTVAPPKHSGEEGKEERPRRHYPIIQKTTSFGRDPLTKKVLGKKLHPPRKRPQSSWLEEYAWDDQRQLVSCYCSLLIHKGHKDNISSLPNATNTWTHNPIRGHLDDRKKVSSKSSFWRQIQGQTLEHTFFHVF